MLMTLNRKNEYSGFRFLICILFAMIFLSQCTAAGNCETEIHALNSSGNRNIEFSVDPISKSEGFCAVLYDNKNGMPTSEANAIAQTSDGFLWIGSYAGLICYDGNTFERPEPTAGIANIRCLFVDSHDRLWIGTNDAGVFLYHRGEIRHWDKSDGLASVSIRCITEAEDGIIYIGGTLGVGCIDASFEFTPMKDERLSGQTVTTIRLGIDGLAYGVSNTGNIYLMKEGKLVSCLWSEDFPYEEALTILPDPEHSGFLYVGTEHYVCHGSPEQGFDSWDRWDVSPLQTIECLEYMNGQIWICARTGIGNLDHGELRLLRDIPMNNSFCHIMTDSEGNLWITSARQGVMKIVPDTFVDLFDQYGLTAEVVNSTCLADGQLFIGTDRGLIIIENGKKLNSLPVTDAVTASGTSIVTTDLLEFLDGIRIRSIIRDSVDRLWISTARERGLIRYDRGVVTQFTEDDGILSETIRVVSECMDGTIFVATNDGINVIEGDHVVKGYGQEDGIDVRMILTITEGYNGELIAGSDGGGIYIITPDGMKRIGTGDGLTSDVILRIRRSHMKDLYWIVTGNSLAFMTPDYQVTTVRNFPYANNYDLYENSNGDLWVLGSSGIYVVPFEYLNEEGIRDPVFFGVLNGLPYTDTANSYSELTQDGILYIAGSEGVIKVNIEEPFKSIKELKIAVPYVDADGERYYPDETGSFTLPAKARKLTVYPHVFNYSLVDSKVSYRLEGFDAEAATVRRSRLVPVDYTNLRVGTYQFVMTAKDPVSGTEQSTSFRITKGREMTAGTVGSIFIDIASLFLMTGILIYTSIYRKRGLLEDRLFFGMTLSNIALAVADGISCFMEGSSYPASKEIMIAGNIVFYTMFAVFPYLYLLYFDYSAWQDKERIRKMKLPAGIPCLLLFILLLVNLKTGWIYTFSEDNIYHSGPLNNLVFVPALISFLLSLFRLYKINIRLAFLSTLLILTRIAMGIWFRDISSTAFTYTLFLVCTHIYVMNKPIYEVAS